MRQVKRETMPKTAVPHGVAGNDRINTFSDGVFAIAITLLVLELKVPETLPHGGVVTALVEMAPKFAGHVLSFVVLGVYWVGHHNVFMHIHRHDRTLLWLNIAFLMFVGAMPFFAGLLVQHSDDPFSLVVYCANLAVAGVFLDIIWWYATRGRRLVDPKIDSHLIRLFHRRVLTAPVIYLVSIPIAFFNSTAALLVAIIVPLTYMFPGLLDQHHHRQLGGSGRAILDASEE